MQGVWDTLKENKKEAKRKDRSFGQVKAEAKIGMTTVEFGVGFLYPNPTRGSVPITQIQLV